MTSNKRQYVPQIRPGSYRFDLPPGYVRLHAHLAMEIGLNESIVLMQFHEWITGKSGEFIDGSIWIRETLQEIHEAIPYLSMATISRALKRLEDRNLLMSTDKYNKMGYDRTRWYAFDPRGLAKLYSITVLDAENRTINKESLALIFQNEKSILQNATSILQNDTTIPDISSNSSSDSSKRVYKRARTLLEISEEIRPSDNQPLQPETPEPLTIVTEKESDLSADATTAPIPGSGAPLSPPIIQETLNDPVEPPRKLCRTCKQTKPVIDFVDPGTGRQYAAKCNACRAEDDAIKKAVAEKIAAEDAASPPPLEVVRNHPLWQAYRETIVTMTEALYDMRIDPEIPKLRIDAHLAAIEKLSSEGITPETVKVYVEGRMRKYARQNERTVYRFEYLSGDINDVRACKPVVMRAVTAFDWSTAAGCIAIAENAGNAPETRAKALNKLRGHSTLWDVDTAQIERISAMLSRVSEDDLEQEMAA